MKKLSLRMRMTVVTSLCLSIAAIVMMLALFWLANIQVVQYIDMEISENSEVAAAVQEHLSFEYSPMEALPIQEAQSICDNALFKGLTAFHLFGLGVLMAVVVTGSATAWIVSGWSIAPVKDLCKQIDRIDDQHLTTHIDNFSSGDELQKLAKSFNHMLGRLDWAFEREKRFSAAAAHELKTPLTVMKASIDILELSDQPTQEDYQETIDQLKKQITRLNSLVSDLLTFTRCQDTSMRTPVDLTQFLKNQIADLKVSYPEITVAEGRMDPCTLMGKPAIVERVLFNLLDNAAKFSPSGGVVHVELRNENHNIVFCVKDEGIGISDDAAMHIFEPFYREDPSRNRKIAGAGLGLTLVKVFADAYGGTILYSRNTPRGSIFTLSIPQEK